MLPLTRAAKLARDRSFALFLANFAVGKGLAFFGPIALGLLLAPEVYGQLEFALAGAQIAALAATLGVPSAAMQLVLMRIGRSVTDLLAGVAAIIGILSVAAAVLLPVAGLAQRFALLAAFSCLCAMQQSGVAYARAHNLRNFNVWIDHAPTVSAVGLAAGLTLFHVGIDVVHMTRATATLGALAVVATGLIAWNNRAGDFAARLFEASAIGLPMVAASVVGAWMISSGRVYAGTLLTENDVYAYAFVFRVASVLVLLHAVIITAFAAQLYRMPTRRFDPIAAVLIAVVACGALALIVVQPERLAAAWVAATKAQLLAERPALSLVPLQVFFWIAGALVEGRVSRARRAGRGAVLNASVALVGAVTIAGVYASGTMRFQTLMIVLTGQQAMACGVLHWVLWRRRLLLSRTVTTTTIAGAALTIFALVR